MNHALSVQTTHFPLFNLRSLGRSGLPVTTVGRTLALRISGPFISGEPGFGAKLEVSIPNEMNDRPAIASGERSRALGALLHGDRIDKLRSCTLGLGSTPTGTGYAHPVTLVADPGVEPIILRMLSALGADIEPRQRRLAIHARRWCRGGSAALPSSTRWECRGNRRPRAVSRLRLPQPGADDQSVRRHRLSFADAPNWPGTWPSP